MIEYEVRRELFRVTEWRDGAVYKTESLGYAWFDEKMVKDNNPAETNLIYAAPSTKGPFAGQMNIRRKRGR